MSQEDVYSFLKSHPNQWFSAKEIAFKLNRSVGSIQRNTLKLYRWKEIKRLKVKRKNNILYLFKIKEEAKEIFLNWNPDNPVPLF